MEIIKSKDKLKVFILGVAGLLLFTAMTVSAAIGDTYNAAAGYSSETQGANGWYYEYFDTNTNQYEQMQYNYTSGSNIHWRYDGGRTSGRIGHDFSHAGSGDIYVSRTWIVPESGAIRIDGWARRIQSTSSNGTGIIIKIDGAPYEIYNQTFGQGSGDAGKTQLNYSVYAYVNQGDKLRFIGYAVEGNTSADETRCDINITYIDPFEIPVKCDIKSAVFKENGVEITTNNIPTTHESQFSVDMEVENLSAIPVSPAAVLALYSTGNELIGVQICDSTVINPAGTDVISVTVTIPDGVTSDLFAKAFLFNNMEDIKPFSENVSFPGSYIAEEGFSAVQGANGWYYEYIDKTTNEIKLMEHHWYSSGNSWTASPNSSTFPGYAILGPRFTHPHTGVNVSRRWLVPKTGAIKIEGFAERTEQAPVMESEL